MSDPGRVRRNEDAVALDLPRESDGKTALSAAAPLAIACFRGRSTVSVLVSKQECLILQVRAMLRATVYESSCLHCCVQAQTVWRFTENTLCHETD